MKQKSMLLLLLLAIISSALVGGCGKKADTADGGPSTAEKPTITQSDADKRIQDIQGNKNIPENAKPGIIAQIQGSVKK